MQELEVTHELALEHGLTDEEFERIIKILGRIPSFTELGIFSVMWSEHCSYKNSIKLLKTLPRSGGRLLVEAGEENAGLVDIGDGLAVAFKIESHNHPSADEPYQDNPLVNAMSVGLVNTEHVASAIAKGEGNPVMIVGSSTGRDGIHGATFASEEISEKSEAKRPSVQAGDPFTEKLLLEATLEIIKQDLVVGIQDMGAAGISCSTSEMSARGKSGMNINLDKVPLREKGMTAYEIMLSESQERMLCVVKKGFEDKVKEVFEKWDLHCEIIGEVTNDGLLHISYQGAVKAVIPSFELVLGGGAPVYVRETKEPTYIKEIRKFDFKKIPQPKNLAETFKKIFSSPNIVSKKWVFEQYDSTVRTNTIVGPGCDAAVIHIKDTGKALAMKTDCNSRYVYLNPKEGTKIAVAESARNIVCSGGIPLAITNCLNFGNPYKPENYWQFSQAIEGMGEACRFFNTPVTGGNVSFYNESPNAAVYPTPTIGMVGLVEKLANVTTSFFKSHNDLIYVLGEDYEELGGSEYLKVIHNKVAGDCPHLDLQVELNLHETILALIKNKLIESAHDVSEGGIICALAECCIMNEENFIGAEVNIPIKMREDFSLFSESQSRIIVSVKEKNQKEFESILNKKKQGCILLGKTTIKNYNVNGKINLGLKELSEIYYNTIPRIMNA